MQYITMKYIFLEYGNGNGRLISELTHYKTTGNYPVCQDSYDSEFSVFFPVKNGLMRQKKTEAHMR
jgi:hypothetical protein